MAWVGKIIGFRQVNDVWELDVSYYNDVAPEVSFSKTVRLPLLATKADAIAAIQARGQEVKRVATLNSENIIGQIVPIP